MKLRDRRELLVRAFELFEALLVPVAFLASCAILASNSSCEHLLTDWRVFSVIAVSTLSWHLSLTTSGAYESQRLGLPYIHYLLVLRAAVIASGVMAIEIVVTGWNIIEGQVLVVFFTVLIGLAIASRALLGHVLRHFRLRNRNLRNIIIVGTGNRGHDLAKSIGARPDLGYRILGFVDSQVSPAGTANRSTRPPLGTLDDLSGIISSEPVDSVFIALPIRSSYDEIHRALKICEEQGIETKLTYDLFDLDHVKQRTDQLGNSAVMTLYRGPDYDWRMKAKRTIDAIVSGALLIAISPLLLMVALVIKLDSPGPVFFLQERVGFHKRRFRMIKFRTMVQDAENKLAALEAMNDASGPVFKMKNDPRVTRVGSFLRKTSIDELPQLINVFLGDMSLVGPRPLPVRDVSGFSEDWQRRRFSCRPGITCTWQISGRSDVSFEQWMQMDLDYIDNWSLHSDMKIIFATIPAVFQGRGAY